MNYLKVDGDRIFEIRAMIQYNFFTPNKSPNSFVELTIASKREVLKTTTEQLDEARHERKQLQHACFACLTYVILQAACMQGNQNCCIYIVV